MVRAFGEVLTGKERVALAGWQAASYMVEAASGAASVVVILEDEAGCQLAGEAAARQGLAAKVEVVQAGLTEVTLGQRADVVMYLPVSTWMLEGPDAAVLAHLAGAVLKSGGQLIPWRVAQLMELAHVPTGAGGLEVRAARLSRPGEPVAILSESKHFLTTEFASAARAQDGIDDTIFIHALLGGVASGLRLSSMVELVPGVALISSEQAGGPILAPFKEDVVVEAGQTLSVHVRYRPGQGLETARFSARLALGTSDRAELAGDHPVVQAFKTEVEEMLRGVDAMGRGADLDRVVSYTREPHGDVSRLTAMFWTVDDDFHKPLRKLIEGVRRAGAEASGQTPGDEAIYQWMLEVYEAVRAEA
ncbi:hypothetical protein DL240_09925 [Lujinxingia litoralis]|uniref:Uncharacterized protein n=1 Tax=Lujinxingia litoralis TaxID=2211119 RepID=A0A328C949_9DELT|nr:hypothetical protein DL240_09925 [Lujinxingia litoralis]